MNFFRKTNTRSGMPEEISAVPAAKYKSVDTRTALADLICDTTYEGAPEIIIFDQLFKAGQFGRGTVINLVPVFLLNADHRIRILTAPPENEQKFFAKHPFMRAVQEKDLAGQVGIRFTRQTPTNDFMIRGDGMFFKNPATGLREAFGRGTGFLCAHTKDTLSAPRVEHFREDFDDIWSQSEDAVLAL